MKKQIPLYELIFKYSSFKTETKIRQKLCGDCPYLDKFWLVGHKEFYLRCFGTSRVCPVKLKEEEFFIELGKTEI